MEEQVLTELALSHYTEAHLILEDRTYEQSDGEVYAKPRGFWVSCDGDDDWADWCRSEDFHTAGLAVRTTIRLKPEANVIMLKSYEDILAFTEKYGKPSRYSSYASAINWAQIAEEYDGIIITPYIWQARLEMGTSWYYTWDCASGCIWNTSVLEIV